MKQNNGGIKAIFFDLWDSLITGSSRETIIEWYRRVTGSDTALYNRERCMTISEEDPDKFLEKFLLTVEDIHSFRLLFSIKNQFSPVRQGLIEGFRKNINEDSGAIRWLPGALETLEALRRHFIIVGIGNVWGYQKPYLRNNLGVQDHFDHMYFSSDLCLPKVELLKRAMGDLKLKPEQVLMVGDRYDNDIMPAIELGMRALKVNAGKAIDPAQFLDDVERAIGLPESKTQMMPVRRAPRKCLFIIPPYYKMFQSHNNRINLGITTLVEMCEAAGISAKVFHADSAGLEHYPTRYQILLNSINFYENLNSHRIFDEIRDFVKNDKPDIVVITSGDVLNAFTDTGCWPLSLRVAREARLASPGSYIISYGPESGEQLGDFDAAITQEAETDFPDILKSRPRGVLKTRFVTEPELKALPLFKKDRFVQDISPKGFDITYWRRGCVGKCHFCRVAANGDGKERFRPLEKFLEDIEYRYNDLKLRNLYFVDPNFTSNSAKLALFAKEAKKRFPEISWRAESRFDTLDEKDIACLKEGGCNYLKLGLENALGEDHQTPGKKVSLQKAREKIQLLHTNGIKCVVYLMLGGYWYTRHDYEKMYQNSVQLGADSYTVSIMTPYVGTGVGVTKEEWDKWGFTGSHLDIRLIDYWKIPVDIVEKFYTLEVQKGREDARERKYVECSAYDTALRQRP